MLAQSDPHAKVAAYAHLARVIAEPVGTIAAQLGSGGAEAAEITAETDRERVAGTTNFVGHLATSGHLRPGVDPAQAAGACWVLIAPQVYRMCTTDRGWTADAYEAWLTEMLTATLI